MGTLSWVLLISALVPFDVPCRLPYLPPLSIIDYLCAFALIYVFCQKGPRGFFRNLPRGFGHRAFFLWIGFALWALLAAFVTHGSLRSPLRWGEFLFCFILGRLAIEDSKDSRRRFAQGLSWVGSAIAFAALVQCVQHRGDYTRVYATFMQHNVLAAYLSPCLFASIALYTDPADKASPIQKGSFFLIAAAILAAASRGAWMGLLASAAFVPLARNRFVTRSNLLLIGMGMAVLIPLTCSVLNPNAGRLDQWSVRSYNEIDPLSETKMQSLNRRAFGLSLRPAYWNTAGRIARAHPWIGLGPGGYAAHLRDFLDGRAREFYDYELLVKKRVDFWQHLHSIYLQILVEYGFPGLLLWGLAMSALAAPALSKIVPGAPPLDRIIPLALIAFFVHNSVDILFVNSIDLMMAFIMAMWT